MHEEGYLALSCLQAETHSISPLFASSSLGEQNTEPGRILREGGVGGSSCLVPAVMPASGGPDASSSRDISSPAVMPGRSGVREGLP